MDTVLVGWLQIDYDRSHDAGDWIMNERYWKGDKKDDCEENTFNKDRLM